MRMTTSTRALPTETVQQLVTHFRDLQDPRRVERCDHLLVDILVIAILAVICEAWPSLGKPARTG